MDALLRALVIARTFEGCRLTPYLDPAGIPSIGYGTTHYEDGTAVTLADPAISQARAESLLMNDMRRALISTLKLCPGAVTASQQAALADFCYNLGAGRLSASTLRRRVNAGDPQAAGEFAKWIYGGGSRLNGLVARRQAEALEFDS